MDINTGSGPLTIPADVLQHIHSTFAKCNGETSASTYRLPTLHEPFLDQLFISTLAKQSSPTELESGWRVEFETHFLGGGGYLAWEIADIGVVLRIRDARKDIVFSKLALLQSKRLYPNEAKPDEKNQRTRIVEGFGGLLRHPGVLGSSNIRTFSFTDTSRYEALTLTSEQATRIELWEAENMILVHYLLYNPLRFSLLGLPRRMESAVALPSTSSGCADRAAPSSVRRSRKIG